MYYNSGKLTPTFVPVWLVGLTVKLAFAYALSLRFPSVVSQPLNASATLWEATAPVKLPTRHGPGTGKHIGETTYGFLSTRRAKNAIFARAALFPLFRNESQEKFVRISNIYCGPGKNKITTRVVFHR